MGGLEKVRYSVVPTSRFKKEYKRAIKRGQNVKKLHAVVDLLVKGGELPESLRDHELKGKWKGHRELHIESDWLLIYQKQDDILVLELTRTGSHADLFSR